jgi:hypothetical protein
MAATVALTPYPLLLPAPTVRFLVTAWWTCTSSGSYTWRDRSDALVASGLPLSIVPPTTRDDMNLDVYPVPGWRGQVPSWFGIPCRIGRVKVWVPTVENPGQLLPYSVLALFPRQDLTDAPPYIHLGAQFFLEHGVQVILDGQAVSNSRLVLP